MLEHLRIIARRLKQGARLMVGQPDYQVYLAHMRAHHPERQAMSYEEFFRDRLDARYGGANGRTGRCC